MRPGGPGIHADFADLVGFAEVRRAFHFDDDDYGSGHDLPAVLEGEGGETVFLVDTDDPVA